MPFVVYTKRSCLNRVNPLDIPPNAVTSLSDSVKLDEDDAYANVDIILGQDAWRTLAPATKPLKDTLLGITTTALGDVLSGPNFATEDATPSAGSAALLAVFSSSISHS